MRRLGTTKSIIAAARERRVGKQPLQSSIDFLARNAETLARYESVEDFALAGVDSQASVLGACEHHLVTLRAALAAELWSREAFIGVSVLDELLFQALKARPDRDPLEQTVCAIRHEGLHRPGLVVFPIHSLGLVGAGLFEHATRGTVDLIESEFHLAISPQTNSLDRTLAFLSRAGRALAIPQKIPVDLIRHWSRSRPADWLTKNPLLVVAVRSFPGSYYENQFLLLTTLRATASFVLMLSSLLAQPENDESLLLGSTSHINNFQTLDLKHYLVLHTRPGRKRELEGDCVPMSVRAAELVELSDIGVELDPTLWNSRRTEALDLFKAIQRVKRGFLRHTTQRSLRNSFEAKLFRKLTDSLSFFRRSFRRQMHREESVVNLAIAFEVLLTDRYESGVTNRVYRRANLALAHEWKGTFDDVLGGLFKARGSIVHEGGRDHRVDLLSARAAYVRCFSGLVAKLRLEHAKCEHPIAKILNDVSK